MFYFAFPAYVLYKTPTNIINVQSYRTGGFMVTFRALSTSSLLALIIFTTHTSAQVPRSVVLEFCTGTWCQWCPCGHQTAEALEAAYPNLVALAYHGGGTDPWRFFDGYAVRTQLGFAAYPTAIIDRRNHPGNGTTFPYVTYTQWAGLVNQRYAASPTSPIELTVTSRSFNAATRQFDLAVTAKAFENLSGTYMMSVILYEDSLVYAQTGNSTCGTPPPNYIHERTVRRMVNGTVGDTLSRGVWYTQQRITKTVSTILDTSWVPNHCSFAVLVYRDSTNALYLSEVMQAIKGRVTCTPTGNFIVKLVESDGNEWPLQVGRDSIWQRFEIPLRAFGSGADFLNTPVVKLVIQPLGGGGIGPFLEVADCIDNLILADSVIDNFDDGNYSDWVVNVALNGSYLNVTPDSASPDGSARCLKLAHGNTMMSTFAGYAEKTLSARTLTPNDTLKFWLRGRSYMITDVDENEKTPLSFELKQNYPNPFNPTTTIKYQIPEVGGQRSEVGLVRLKVFDLLGREVATLVNEVKQPGNHTVQWNAHDVASGVYIYRLTAGEFIRAKKLMVIR